MGVADLPVETLKALKIHPDVAKKSKAKSATSQAQAEAPAAADEDSRPDSSQPTSHPSRSSQTSSPDSQPSVPTNPNTTNSPPSQPASTPKPYNVQEALAPKPYNAQEALTSSNFTLDTAVGTTLSATRIVSAGLKSPMDFTSSLARGFHNAPRLYGDSTVRKSEKITGFSSGLRAAGHELQYGLYDGISGLVTQPLEGARREGATGFFKGFAKGIGGVVFKPAAAFWGIPGHTSRGVYKELRRRFGPSVEGYIVASRTAQGLAELAHSTPAEREAALAAWLELDNNAGARKRTETSPTAMLPPAPATAQVPAGHDAEMEEAIRRSVAETSRGDEAEDAAVERAIRASVADLEEARRRGAEEEELRRAMEESIVEAGRGVFPADGGRGSEGGGSGSGDAGGGGAGSGKEKGGKAAGMTDEEAAREEEIVMRYVMRQSLAEEEARRGRA